MGKKILFYIKFVLFITVLTPAYFIGFVLHGISAVIRVLAFFLMGSKYSAIEEIENIYSYQQCLKDSI